MHQNIVGVNPQYVIKVTISIVNCLQSLNEKCNIIHGDVKPRNFVATRDNEYYTAIDLDNVSIIKKESAGKKRISSAFLPPEQANVEHSIRLSGKIHVDIVDGVDNADRLRAAWKDFVEKTKL